MLKMKKTVALAYTIDKNHKGAPYTFDGIHYMNNGEFSEAELKACLGLKAKKDANTPYNLGSDIPEYSASVKSSKATLTSARIGNDYITIKNTYFENTASTCWIWVSINGDELTSYTMSKNEFSDFMDAWALFQKDRQVIRFKTESKKMLEWLEARLK